MTHIFRVYAGLFAFPFTPQSSFTFQSEAVGGSYKWPPAQRKKNEAVVWMFRWARQRRTFVKRVTQPASLGITLSCIGTAKSMIAVLKIPPNRRSLIQEADIEQTRKFDETQDSQEA